MNLRKDHSHEVPFTTVDWQRCIRLYDCPWRSLAPASYFCWHNGERQVHTVKTEPTSATVNALVRGSRKSTANCDKHCDVQHSESERNFERDSCIEESSLCIWIVVVYGIGSCFSILSSAAYRTSRHMAKVLAVPISILQPQMDGPWVF